MHQDTDAQGYTQLVVQRLEARFRIKPADMPLRMASGAADGASVMQGIHGGALKLIQTRHAPFLLPRNCSAHRSSLSSKVQTPGRRLHDALQPRGDAPCPPARPPPTHPPTPLITPPGAPTARVHAAAEPAGQDRLPLLWQQPGVQAQGPLQRSAARAQALRWAVGQACGDSARVGSGPPPSPPARSAPLITCRPVFQSAARRAARGAVDVHRCLPGGELL